MNLFFILKEGIISLKRARVSAVIAILSIGLSLTLIGIFTLTGYNLKEVFLKFYKQIEIEAFLDPSLSQKQIDNLISEIEKNSQVDKANYISPEQALEEFKENFGEDISAALDENPLPPSLRITINPSYSSPEHVENLTKQLSSMKGIQEVLFQKDIIQFIHKYFSLGVLLTLFFATLLLIVITILIFNTIRLTIHARRDIIQIMKLVGATNLFIKSPFIIEGMIQGLAGGLLAIGAIKLLSNIIQRFFFPQLHIAQEILVIILISGTLLGFMGSYLSVNKYLKY